MADFIIAIGGVFLLLLGWVLVQTMARAFAARHPQFGPAREEGGGCGSSCQCSGGSCRKKQTETNLSEVKLHWRS